MQRKHKCAQKEWHSIIITNKITVMSDKKGQNKWAGRFLFLRVVSFLNKDRETEWEKREREKERKKREKGKKREKENYKPKIIHSIDCREQIILTLLLLL